MDWWENGKWYCPSPHPPWFLDRLGILKDCRWIEQSQGFMKEADPAVLACEVLRRMCKTDHSPTTGDSVECSWIPPTAVLLAADISVSPEEICKSLVDDLGVSWFLLKPIQVPVRDENDHIFCLDMSYESRRAIMFFFFSRILLTMLSKQLLHCSIWAVKGGRQAFTLAVDSRSKWEMVVLKTDRKW